MVKQYTSILCVHLYTMNVFKTIRKQKATEAKKKGRGEGELNLGKKSETN